MGRMRRTALVVLTLGLTGAALFTAAACGTVDSSSGVTTPEPAPSATPDPTSQPSDVALAMSQTPRIAPSAAETDVAAASRAIQAFGLDLYQRLAEAGGDQNLVFSPASIVTALVMTYAGAAGTTAQEMAQTLHLGLPADTLHPSFNALDTLLESGSWSGTDHEGKDVGVVVKTANSLWTQLGLAFEQKFLDILAANYGAGVRLVDYKTGAEEARLAINAWVSGETEDKIPELIPAGGLDALTRLVLVNAVYLDATWATQFDRGLTQEGRFRTLAGSEVTAQMMRQSSGFPYAADEGWQAVELPYLQSELAMLLIVPDAGRFAEVEAQLQRGLLDGVVAKLAPGPEVHLTMPKFEFRTQTSLSDALRALGMASAFAYETADFTGMTAQERLFISEVIHEAYIAVDEEGTEAAAATAVVMRTASAPMETVDLTIDRPFLFALRDTATGALLFLGRVTDPSA